jgi:hypothetical protein
VAPCLEFGCVLRVRPVRYQRDSIRQLSRALPNANTILQPWEKSSSIESIESILNYSPALIITIGMVGEAAPASSSTVMANALAIVSGGSGGLTTVALP